MVPNEARAEHLIHELTDPAWGARMTAVESLGRLGAATGVSQALAKMLEDENEWVRSSAAQALDKLGYQDGVLEVLMKTLTDDPTCIAYG